MNNFKCIFAMHLSIFLMPFLAVSQDSAPYNFKQADSLIQALSEEADFQALQDALDEHLAVIDQNNIKDSLYKYTYLYGRALSKLEGSAMGTSKTEEYVNRVIELDSNKSHQLQAISDLSWIYIEAGNDSMCFETDKRYLELVQNYPEASPNEKYMAHYALGFDNEMLGLSKEAIFHFKESLKPVIIDSIKYVTNIMDGYNGLGAAYWRDGQLAKAKIAFNKSLSYAPYYTDTLKALMYESNALGNISLVYEDEGNLVKSKELLEQSLRKRKIAINGLEDSYQIDQQTRHLIRNYHNLAALYLNLGDLERSRKMTEFTQDLRLKNLPEDHPDHAKALEAFGSIEYAQSNYKQALLYFKQSLEEQNAYYGPNTQYGIIGNERLGKAYQALGDYDNALTHFNRAIEIDKEIKSEDSSQLLAKSYYFRSEVFVALERYEEAESDLRKTESIYAKTRAGDDFMFGRVYLDMSYLKSARGQLDSAEFYVDKSLNLRESEDEERFSKFNIELKYLPETYSAKAALLADKGDKENLIEALVFAKKGKNLIKKARVNYEEELSQIALYEQQSKIFDVAIRAAYGLYEITKDKSYIDEIHLLSEESKSIILRQQLNKFTSLRVNQVPDTLLVKENILLSTISGKISEVGPDELLNAEKEYSSLIQYFKDNYPDYYSLRYDDFTVSIKEIQNDLLKENQNLIEFILAKSGAYGILIGQNNVEIKELDLSNVQDEIKNYNKLITERDDDYKKAAHQIYKSLFYPFEDDFNGNEILIVPDNGIFNLNFETFIKDTLANKNDYLIYHYDFSYLLSATTAYQFRSLDRKEGNGFLAFAPGFTDEMKSNYRKGVKDSLFIDHQYLSSIQQPFSIQTATQVAGIFSGDAFTTNEATEKNFKKLANDYAIIHLGTHTEINNLSPLLSRFILTKPGQADQDSDDGYLHAYEIYNMPLRAELAVLTACETGIGKETSSEGVLSIAHSFAYAGCPSIVMSIWQIDEKTSAEIIENFYANLKDGINKNQALKQAKLDYLRNHSGELLHPYYWSGIVLVGNTDAIAPQSTSNDWLAYVLIGLMGMLLTFIVVRRIKSKKNTI